MGMAVYITRFIDFFYPPFKRFMTVDFFRYVVCGSSIVAFDWILYFIVYNFVIQRNPVELPFITFTPYIAALLLTFPITFMLGFYLSRNVTFSGSPLRGRIQLFRYMVIVFINLVINYIGLKIFVELLRIFPTPSKMLTTVFTTLFSYFAQKHYSFKKH
jgi:hypothetical protein